MPANGSIAYGQLYEETSQTWASLLDDATLKDVTNKLEKVQAVMTNMRGLFKALSPVERMQKRAKNKDL